MRSAVESREERWQQRLALPVLVAALASVPAMFLSIAGGVWGTTGLVIDALSSVVLLAELVILFVVAEHKRAWVRRHHGMLALGGAIVLAVVLALGPVQVLRLIRAVGALRILRAGRIVKAARSLRARLGFTGRLSSVLSVGAGVLVAVFVGVVLADPTSRSHDLLAGLLGGVSTTTVVVTSVLAGLLLGVATFLLARDHDDDVVDPALSR